MAPIIYEACAAGQMEEELWHKLLFQLSQHSFKCKGARPASKGSLNMPKMALPISCVQTQFEKLSRTPNDWLAFVASSAANLLFPRLFLWVCLLFAVDLVEDSFWTYCDPGWIFLDIHLGQHPADLGLWLLSPAWAYFANAWPATICLRTFTSSCGHQNAPAWHLFVTAVVLAQDLCRESLSSISR